MHIVPRNSRKLTRIDCEEPSLRRKKRRVFYWLMKSIVIGPVVNALFRPWVKGLENIPAQGGALLVSNHLSFSDSIFLPLQVPRTVAFLAKSEYFTGQGMKGKMTRLFFQATNQIPMDRSGGQASQDSLAAGSHALREGKLLGIYPEGTRSPDGRLYKGKIGAAKMALEAGVPVIPVAMIGTDKVQPIGKKIPKIKRVGIIIGEPLDFSRYAGQQEDHEVLRSMTDEMMTALMRLSGQEYVDVYAAEVKAQIAAERLDAVAKKLGLSQLTDKIQPRNESDEKETGLSK